MTVEIIHAIGSYIVSPVCVLGAFVAFLYFVSK